MWTPALIYVNLRLKLTFKVTASKPFGNVNVGTVHCTTLYFCLTWYSQRLRISINFVRISNDIQVELSMGTDFSIRVSNRFRRCLCCFTYLRRGFVSGLSGLLLDLSGNYSVILIGITMLCFPMWNVCLDYGLNLGLNTLKIPMLKSLVFVLSPETSCSLGPIYSI